MCRPAEAARLFERTLETIQWQQQHASDTKPLKVRIHHSATHNGLCSRGLGEKEKATPLRTHQSNTTKEADGMNGRHFRQKFCGSIQPCSWACTPVKAALGVKANKHFTTQCSISQKTSLLESQLKYTKLRGRKAKFLGNHCQFVPHANSGIF